MPEEFIKQNFVCHCADLESNFSFFDLQDIRKKVCQDLPFYGEIEGRDYCVLHYPGKDKVEEFEKVFQERIKADRWDFRTVYFPSKIEIKFENRKEFHNDADFSYATFSESIILRYCKFYGRFIFYKAKFLEDCDFMYSEFYGSVIFNSAYINETGDFSGTFFDKTSYPSFNKTTFKSGLFGQAKFYGEARFPKAIFTDYAYFEETEYFSKADFKEISLPKNKETEFRAAKFHQAVDFENVEFFEANFFGAKFAISSSQIFNQIIFKNCKFTKKVNFAGTEFNKIADFSEASFDIADFSNSTFSKGAYFRSALFFDDVFFNDTKFGFKDEHRIGSSEVHFEGAEFKENSRVFFDKTWFSYHTHFQSVKFSGYVFFIGGEESDVFDTVFEKRAYMRSLLNIFDATFEKPEKVYFHTVRLRPSWLVNLYLDLRKCNLINIKWLDENRNPITIEGELKSLGERTNRINSKILLNITLRQLAENAEINSRFEDASTFRRMAFETERLLRKDKQLKWWTEEMSFSQFFTKFRGKLKNVPFDPTHFIYRISSRYGENWSWATLVLLIILGFWAFLYTLSNFQVCPVVKSVPESRCETRTLYVGEAIRHSLASATFQNIEHRKPTTGWGEAFVILEKIFAPLQAALLALAIRRKFMR
jgi:uncharacterized protein YjbI with pentapeptide repeats